MHVLIVALVSLQKLTSRLYVHLASACSDVISMDYLSCLFDLVDLGNVIRFCIGMCKQDGLSLLFVPPAHILPHHSSTTAPDLCIWSQTLMIQNLPCS